MSIKIRFRFDGRCSLHPRYDPGRDGRPQHGSCEGCESLYIIHLYIARETGDDQKGLVHERVAWVEVIERPGEHRETKRRPSATLESPEEWSRSIVVTQNRERSSRICRRLENLGGALVWKSRVQAEFHLR